MLRRELKSITEKEFINCVINSLKNKGLDDYASRLTEKDTLKDISSGFWQLCSEAMDANDTTLHFDKEKSLFIMNLNTRLKLDLNSIASYEDTTEAISYLLERYDKEDGAWLSCCNQAILNILHEIKDNNQFTNIQKGMVNEFLSSLEKKSNSNLDVLSLFAKYKKIEINSSPNSDFEMKKGGRFVGSSNT